MNSVLFSSKSDEYGTPQDIYDGLNEEFHFDLDPSSTDENCKCPEHYTIYQNGLAQDWGGHRVFCNPPYSRIKDWVQKAYRESLKRGTVVVLLVPARTDTKWFHNYIYHRAEVRFIKGRLKFDGGKSSAPFPSMVVIFRAPERG